MRSEIRALHQRLKTTMIYVTHDQVEAMTMADKIVVMQDGYIEQIGSPLDLYDHPVNIFVASFIGSPSMNLIEGVIRVGETPEVEARGTRLPCPEFEGLEDGQKVIFGIRPEHFEIAESGMPAKVALIEPTGAETHVIMKFGNQDIVAVFRERHEFEPGQMICLKAKRKFIHIFDPQSGKRLS
jgi:multiple sugar transport system ATP-binding protein